MIRPGNIVAAGILTVSGGALVIRAAVRLTEERPVAHAVANTAAESPVVRVAGFAFPESITVAAGGTVTWVNDDSSPHTVSFATAIGTTAIGATAIGTTASIDLAPAGQGTVTFADAGTFEYVCDVHPSMTGRVLVTAPTNDTDTDPDPNDPNDPDTNDPDNGGY